MATPAASPWHRVLQATSALLVLALVASLATRGSLSPGEGEKSQKLIWRKGRITLRLADHAQSAEDLSAAAGAFDSDLPHTVRQALAVTPSAQAPLPPTRRAAPGALSPGVWRANGGAVLNEFGAPAPDVGTGGGGQAIDAVQPPVTDAVPPVLDTAPPPADLTAVPQVVASPPPKIVASPPPVLEAPPPAQGGGQAAQPTVVEPPVAVLPPAAPPLTTKPVAMPTVAPAAEPPAALPPVEQPSAPPPTSEAPAVATPPPSPRPPRAPYPPLLPNPPPLPPSPPRPNPPFLAPAPAPSGDGVLSNNQFQQVSGMSTGLIIGIAVGSSVALLALVAFTFFCCCVVLKPKAEDPEASAFSGGASQSKLMGASAAGAYSRGKYSGLNDGASMPPSGGPGGSMMGGSSDMALFGAAALGGAAGMGAAGALGSFSSPAKQSQSWFAYDILDKATNNFSPANKLGEGGFGKVYKGVLPDSRVVAVKVLTIGGGQGEREFRAEVEIISRVHHRHLVTLQGYCIARDQRLLVYDYVPNGTLESALHGKSGPVMSWDLRLKCAIGAAKGLAYLHEDCHPRIIHRDIKSSNILLDAQCEAQVADFGLAKLAVDNATHVSTRVMGTFGYLAPEYAMSGKLTDKSDVFSFGVVLLELISGRRPVDPNQPPGKESLVEWARPHLAANEVNLLVDPRLEGRYDEAEMERMVSTAALCVRHSSGLRPRMGQVVRLLEGASDVPAAGSTPLGMSMLYEGSPFGGNTQDFDSAIYSAEMRQQYGTPSPAHQSTASLGAAVAAGVGVRAGLATASSFDSRRSSSFGSQKQAPVDRLAHQPDVDSEGPASAAAFAANGRSTSQHMDTIESEDDGVHDMRDNPSEASFPNNDSKDMGSIHGEDPYSSAPLPPPPGWAAAGEATARGETSGVQLPRWSAGGGGYGSSSIVEDEGSSGYPSYTGYSGAQSSFMSNRQHIPLMSGVSDAGWSIQFSEKLNEGR